MNKAYHRINNGKGWENYPSDKTAVDEFNLNHMEIGIDEIDNRVVVLEDTKATKLEVSELFRDVSLDLQSGIITFTRKNGATVVIDTPMEKIQTGIYYDPVTEMLVLPLIDGTSMEVDLSRLMKFDEFIDSDTIAFSVKANGAITAIVKEGSIEEKHLRPDYLADIRLEQSKAQSSAVKSEEFAKLSESYTHGGTGVREGEETDNAMEYARQAKESADRANNIVSGGLVTGVKGDNENLYRTGNVNIGMGDILQRYSVTLLNVPMDNSWHDIEFDGIWEGINIVKAVVTVRRGDKIHVGIYTGMFNWAKINTEISDVTEEIPLDFSGDIYRPPMMGGFSGPVSRLYLRKAWGKDKYPSLQLSINRGASGLSTKVELTIINLISFQQM